MITIDKITDEANFLKAHRQTLLGDTKYNQDAIEFNRDWVHNLEKLRQEVIDGTYEFGEYYEFKVYEPKERIINAPCYRDKIVQCAINNVMKEFYFPKFIKDSYSCIDERGTLACANRISEFVSKAKWKYGEKAQIIKIDVKKFFYTINREILKRIISVKVKCKEALELIYKIIDSASKISKLGLPLGNTVSQICANIYMDVVDQIAKRRMSLKFYVRYADDIVIIVESKEKAIHVLRKITEEMKTKLELETNIKKTKIFPISQGVNVVGFKIHPTHRLLRTDSKIRMKRKLRKFPNLIIAGRITVRKTEQMINSWLGHAKNSCALNFVKSLVRRFAFLDFSIISGKWKIKIIEEALYGYCS